MKMEFLKGVDKEIKKQFLAKLQSGKYILGPVYEPVQSLTFVLQKDGLYKCQETGQLMTKEAVESLQGYRGSIELVSDKLQVSGEKLPDGIKLMPYTEEEFLDSLLINK